MGKYRYLLICFAVFDMVYTLVEVVIPVACHVTGAAFVAYLLDGPFYKAGTLGQLAVSIRCSFIGLSYGILALHFIYRYVVLFDHRTLNRMLRPSGLFGLFVFFSSHGLAWMLACEMYLYADKESRDYIYKDFKETYNMNSHELTMLTALFSDGSVEITRRSWEGILILTSISIYAVTLYITLGWKIMHELTNCSFVSESTRKLHKELLKALAVQTFIPIVISFAPCVVAWYSPVLGIGLPIWNEHLCVIALLVFPTLDPLAVAFLLPNYRNKVIRIAKNTLSLFVVVRPESN